MKPSKRNRKKQGRVQVGQKASIQSTATIAEQAKANLGAPVCVVLKDGSYYYGVVADIEANQVILQGFKGDKKLRKKKGKGNSNKAQISGLGGLGSMLGLLGGGGGLGSLFGGGSSGGLLGGLGKGAATGGGGGGIFGNIGSFMKLGMGVISFIMPLMKNFSI